MQILLIVGLLIAYGSLYPGDFSASYPGAFENFLTDWSWFTSSGDLLGNIALFLPLGMAGVLFVTGRRSALRRNIALFFLASVFAFSLQIAQIWLPSRSAALADVMWNVVGMALGMAMGRLVGKRSPAGGRLFPSVALVPSLILFLWLLTELLPLVPSLDWQKFKDALKPLLLTFDFSFPAMLLHAAGVMVAGSALIALDRRPAGWLAGALMLVLAGKLAIVNLNLDASLLTGLLAGYAGCLFVSLRSEKKTVDAAAFWLLLTAGTIAGITPFSPASGGTFNGIPFATMLRGSMEISVQGLTQSLFIYISLLWLAQKMGGSLKAAAVGLAIWTSLIELTQMYWLGRTADVTEPLLVLLLSWGMSVTPKAVTPIASIAARSSVSGRHKNFPPYGRHLLVYGVLLTAVGLGTHAPAAPYNVRELLGNNPLPSVLFLAGILYLTCGVPAWIARYGELAGSGAWRMLPFLALQAGMAWMLLRNAVPGESVHDIVGSPILGWPWEWEVFGRFLALYGAVIFMLTGGAVLAMRLCAGRHGAALLHWFGFALVLLPFLYWVIVKSAATDNLTELMRDGGSIGASIWLALYLFVVGMAGALASQMLARRCAPHWGKVLLVAGSFPLGYMLFNAGTEPMILKYGQIFSAAQFLFSQDREHYVSGMQLLMRYAAFQAGLTALILIAQYPFWRNGSDATPGEARPGKARSGLPSLPAR